MTRYKKQLKRFLDNPDSFKYSRIEKLLKKTGFNIIEAKGSHKKLKHQSLNENLSIPIHNKDCKKPHLYYIFYIVLIFLIIYL